MKYIINATGKLDIEDCQRGIIVIVVKKESFTIDVKDILKVVAETNLFFKIQYKKGSSTEWYQFKAKGIAKNLVDILFMECVGLGNKKAERVV